MNENYNFDPKEMEMGMREETEHSETVGGDKEKIKKIVLDHLREDPKYYTKLRSVMKAGDKLHSFMDWLPEQKKKEFEQLFKQFEVEHFANAEQLKQSTSDNLSEAGEKLKEPKFHATPEQEKIDEFVEKKAEEDKKVSPSGAPGPMPKMQTKTDPFVKKKAEEKVPKIPQSVKQRDYTIPYREKSEKKAEEEGIKDTIKDFVSPPKPKNDKVPALTKTTSRNIIRKIRSGV